MTYESSWQPSYTRPKGAPAWREEFTMSEPGPVVEFWQDVAIRLGEILSTVLTGDVSEFGKLVAEVRGSDSQHILTQLVGVALDQRVEALAPHAHLALVRLLARRDEDYRPLNPDLWDENGELLQSVRDEDVFTFGDQG